MTETSEHGNKLPASRRVPEAADRLDVLVHDLNNLLDGSLRWLAMAISTLETAETEGPAAVSDGNGASGNVAAGTGTSVDRARAQLDTVRGALLRMSELADASIRRESLPIGSPFRAGRLRVTLGEAIAHAVEVQRPIAEEHGVVMDVSVSPDAAAFPAGTLYSVVLNGVRNGLESVIVCGGGGDVSVVARVVEESDLASEDHHPGGLVEIEIIDNGHGPPPPVAGAMVLNPFSHGYSTKPRGTGVGLSIARALVDECGGRIELIPRRAGQASDRPGAVLRCVVPVATLLATEGSA